MKEHTFRLATAPFEAIASGKKTIESRLFDEKRQSIQLGDTIVFTNREDPSQALKVKVVGLLRYKSFADMFAHNPLPKFGGENLEDLLRQINEFYPEDKQKQYGVLGLEFELIS